MYISGPVCGSYDAKMALTPNGRTALYKVYAWMKFDRRSFRIFNGIGRWNCDLYSAASRRAVSTIDAIDNELSD